MHGSINIWSQTYLTRWWINTQLGLI